MRNEKRLPVVFVRELVVFPGMSVTLTVGREASRLAILDSQGKFDSFLVTMTQQRAEDAEIKSLEQVYKVGTVCRVEKAVALTDGGMQVQIEGVGRFRGGTLEWHGALGYIHGESLPDEETDSESGASELLASLSSYQPVNFDKIAWIERNDPDELKRINAGIAKRQKILEEPSAGERVRLLKALGST
jgi:ATP-dependent Lon protease